MNETQEVRDKILKLKRDLYLGKPSYFIGSKIPKYRLKQLTFLEPFDKNLFYVGGLIFSSSREIKNIEMFDLDLESMVYHFIKHGNEESYNYEKLYDSKTGLNYELIHKNKLIKYCTLRKNLAVQIKINETGQKIK